LAPRSRHRPAAERTPDLVRLRKALPDDVPTLVPLINEAYLVEAPFVGGDRTDEAAVRVRLLTGDFLVAVHATGDIRGCVYVEPRDERGYLGMLSVSPAHQGKGLGRKLVTAAETHLAAAGCADVEIEVVSERHGLFPWYERLGYGEVGTRPFPDIARLLQPCHFVVLRKALLPPA
jgi:ribosomal protein S18 acetylase RimI-like enzyme